MVQFSNSKLGTSAPCAPCDLTGQGLVFPPQEADVAAGVARVSIMSLLASYEYVCASAAAGRPGRDGMTEIQEQTERAFEGVP
ncbi:hypothetical protein F5B20DRAFT_586242 [Whalleya microplaca]|nr:hypothetical protein F5B20DRAFT_586242 [Whalleya microplaca]